LCTGGGNGGGDFVLEDFDECFVFGDDCLFEFDLGDALLLITDYADYTDLAIRVYKCMRIYLLSAILDEVLGEAVIWLRVSGILAPEGGGDLARPVAATKSEALNPKS